MAHKTSAALLCLLLLIFSTLSNACKLLPCEPTTTTQQALYPPKDPPANPFCPRNTLKLGACGNAVAVGSLILGRALGSKCCALLRGLTGAEAAACLCTVLIKERVLGVTVEWSVAVSLLVSSCKKEIPDGFKCI